MSCENIENAEVLELMGGGDCQLIDKLFALYYNDQPSFNDDQSYKHLARIFQCIVCSMKSRFVKYLFMYCKFYKSLFEHFAMR